MSKQTSNYLEEEAIKKSYDFKITKRLFGYLKPYWKMMTLALSLTLLTNILIRFTCSVKKCWGGGVRAQRVLDPLPPAVGPQGVM